MKIVKRVSTAMLLFVASVVMLSLNSCGGNDGGLSGWYVSPNADSNGGGAYCFTNGKNVEVYTAIFPNCEVDWMRGNKVTIKGKTYYYNYMSNYTYTYEDGVIYIPMAGQILNKSGDTLRRDGSNDIFKKR